ncbi:DUF4019 domain-containing protein [Sphingomonas sp. RB56-2]|uniref:DUF4019 domain-containing protein n=1 Tax=Sphingomonas brevis TaxID=2908206 RepID=A0ABT0SC04_9SPHN|nr:DUF4019 domain-containing protein [Sphingomonas brevis]MCL6741946.1 DUF4019 domain-containing protein [Sphingomonas brevis]
MSRRLLSIVGALALTACSAGADTKTAEVGVANFHRDVDAGKIAQIYDTSAPEMKSSITRDEFVKLLTVMRTKLGPYKSGKTTAWNINVGTGGHLVTLNREVQFERGPGTEEFVFRVEGGKAVLVGWHVYSNVLITG